MEASIDPQKVLKALEFHGIPLMKVWTEENGHSSLARLNIPTPDAVDTSLYRSRQKFLTQNDNSRRLRLHKFISRSAKDIYKKEDESDRHQQNKSSQSAACQLIPPLECFAQIDIEERLKRFLNSKMIGDIAFCNVLQIVRLGLFVKILCTTGKCSRMLGDINIKCTIAAKNLIPAKDVNNVSKDYAVNDFICCEIIGFDQQSSQIQLGMLGIYSRCDKGPPLGLITKYQLPLFYKLVFNNRDNPSNKFGDYLRKTEVFINPASIDNLLIDSGLDPRKSYSLTMSSKGKFASDEYAKDLRHVHASKLAFRSVAEGIEHFKGGRHIEAFQCLNKALTIDPQNVEGLVARGALYANSGSFQKAIYDFEAALKLNSNHSNAKKYLGETLLALGRSFEDDGKYEDAKKAYIECLKVNPQHQEAMASLEFVKSKLGGLKKIVEPSELELPPLNIGSISMLKDTKMSRDYPAESSKSKDDSKKKKKDKKKKGKKRHSSSSDSSSESSDSSNSSSDSSDSESSSDDSNSRSKKKDKKQKEKSVSPFSKRMDHGESSYHGKSFEPQLDDHEMKVRKFLEMGRDEDDYEDKVRHLMAETSKYQKSMQEDTKGGKKKKKSEKKLKKEKKKRKKEDKKKGKGNDIDSIREALKIFENLPEFSKFQKIYQEKLKEEESKKKQSAAGDNETPQEKWKMKFSKDERKIDTKSKAKPNLGFNYDSEEDEDQSRNSQSQPSLSQANVNYSLASTSGFERKSSPAKDPMKMEQMQPQVPAIVARPVVLDKFGNFRLADPGSLTLPVKSADSTTVSSRRSRDRSRSHRRYSRSRSDSRSPKRRRRSYSRSYSRSRSRSHGRYSSSFRGRGDYANRYRRFSPKRGTSSRGRWNDNNRRDFRGGRDRFAGGRNDRFPRQRFGNNNRFNRSYSRSPDRASRSPDRRDRSPDRRHEDDRRNKWSESDSVGRPDLNEMEEVLRKGREPDSLSESK